MSLPDEFTEPGSVHAVRLFDSDFLEWFTRTSRRAILLFWVPVFGLSLAYGTSLGQFTWAQMALILFAGVAAWTLVEYLMHRFLFHLDRFVPRARPLAFLVHGCHHVDPGDAERDIMPIAGSAPIFALFAPLAIFALGVPLGLALVGAAGFAYLAYDLTHYHCHQGRPVTRLGRAIRRRHLAHHYIDSTGNFGVTSPLWDWFFGTALPTARRR